MSGPIGSFTRGPGIARAGDANIPGLLSCGGSLLDRVTLPKSYVQSHGVLAAGSGCRHIRS